MTAAAVPPTEAVRPEVTICAWCGSTLDDTALRLPGRTRCARCGAATTDPWPSDAELENAYGTWYRPDSGRFGRLGDALLRRSRGVQAKRLDRIAPSGPVLDVGAGDGALLDALHLLGREAIGLERESRRPDVRDTSIEEVTGEWSAVVFWHSLEHLPRPIEAIGAAARLLRSSGVLVIAVPNSDSLQARLFGDRWLHLDPPLHLVHLPERALISGITRHGFAVERVSHVRAGQIVIGWLDGLVGALPGRPRFYQALREAEARTAPLAKRQRATTVATGVLLFPLALGAAAAEVALRRSGTVYIEARRA